MPEATFIDQAIKLWPQGATFIGLCVVAIVLFRHVVTPWLDRQDARAKTRREAAKECAEREEESKRHELEVRLKIAQAQSDGNVAVSKSLETIKVMHENCHTFQSKPR